MKPELSYDEAYTAMGGLRRSRRPPGDPKIPGSMTQAEIDARNDSVIAEQARLEQLGPIANQTQNVYTKVHTRPLGGGDRSQFRYQRTPYEEYAAQAVEFPRVSLHKLWNFGLDAANALGTSQREYHDAVWGIHRSAPLPSAIPQDSPIRNPTIGGVPVLLEDYPKDSPTLAATTLGPLREMEPDLFKDINGDPIRQVPQVYENDWMLNLAGSAQNQSALLAASAALGLSAGAAAPAVAPAFAPQLQTLATTYPRIASAAPIAKYWAESAIPGFAASSTSGSNWFNLMQAMNAIYAANIAQDSIQHGINEFGVTGNPIHSVGAGARHHFANTPLGPVNLLYAAPTMAADIGGQFISSNTVDNTIQQSMLASSPNIVHELPNLPVMQNFNPNAPLTLGRRYLDESTRTPDSSFTSSDPRRRNKAIADASAGKGLSTLGQVGFNVTSPFITPGTTQERDDAFTVSNLELFENNAKNINSEKGLEMAQNIEDAVKANLISRGYSPDKITPQMVQDTISRTGAIYAQNAIEDLLKTNPVAAQKVLEVYNSFNQGLTSNAPQSYYYLLSQINSITAPAQNMPSNSALANNTGAVNAGPTWANELRGMLEANQGQEADLTPPARRSGVSFTF